MNLTESPISSKQNTRQQRQAKGLCSECGEKVPNKGKCLPCREKFRSYYQKYRKTNQQKLIQNSKNTRLYRRENKLCYDCGVPLNGTSSRCPTCLEKNNQRQKISQDRLSHERQQSKLCVKCGQLPAIKKHCKHCLAKASNWSKRYRRDLTLQVLIQYSHGRLQCACCEETEFNFLTLDHMNDDGAKDRNTFTSPTAFFQHLKKEKFPPGYQVLCMNCNMGRYRNGGVCPHKASSMIAQIPRKSTTN